MHFLLAVYRCLTFDLSSHDSQDLSLARRCNDGNNGFLAAHRAPILRKWLDREQVYRHTLVWGERERAESDQHSPPHTHTHHFITDSKQQLRLTPMHHQLTVTNHCWLGVRGF